MAAKPKLHSGIDVVRTARDAQFAKGAFCVWCSSRGVIRWGTFSGRQRYRCRSCLRTFSDLTATMLSNTKRLDAWAEFLECWRRGESVRRTARLIGVHTTTVFRWRHWLCDALRDAEGPQLRGWVEAAHLRFRFSEKGVRGNARASVRATRTVVGRRYRLRVSVIIMRDRYGTVVSDVVSGARANTPEIVESFAPALQGADVLLSRHRRMEPLAATARALALCHRRVPNHKGDPLVHLRNATSHACGFVAWLEHFRGVATRYLNNYLAWYRRVEMLHPEHFTDRTLGTICGNHDQQSERTECDVASGSIRLPP